ncbi:MAG TPA: restriction endonuclease subunit S, partial [Spirochaetota bacterium]|nr:restriction endonuclease subunit S [Spirochaetota bacterium]
MNKNHTSNNIPDLRFSEFQLGWENKLFDEIFSFRSTNSFSREMLCYEFGTIKNIHYGDIHTQFNKHFDITKETVPFVLNEIDLSKIPIDNYCKEGDLVIADASEDYADIGKCLEIIYL